MCSFGLNSNFCGGRQAVRHGRSVIRSRDLMLAGIVFSLVSDVSAQSGSATPPPNPMQPVFPTNFPTGSASPSSILSSPTIQPTFEPSTMPVPTDSPSTIPSDFPSDSPSFSPTPEPTFATPSIATSRFRQDFTVQNGRFLTETEIVLFQGLYASYTTQFASARDAADGRVSTECNFLNQGPTDVRRTLRQRAPGENRRLQTLVIQVDFNMAYESVYTNVTNFPLLFQSFVNSDLGFVALQMRTLGLNVSDAGLASRIVVRPDPTLQPTSTPSPTTLEPSVSTAPSLIPSDIPSLVPSARSLQPSASPSKEPSDNPTMQPSRTNGSNNDGGSEATIIVVSVVVAVSIVLIGLLVYYRKRKLGRELEFRSNTSSAQRTQGVNHGRDESSRDNMFLKQQVYVSQQAGRPTNVQEEEHKLSNSLKPAHVVSPSQSLVSNQSLLSAGNSIGGDSRDELDSTQNLADEFDQYKDQNLEKMRADVEGNLTGFDGMMSQALTRALIDEDDADVDASDFLWGGSGQLVGVEIEASALAEVIDWLKRKETPSEADRRVFMQGALNKMVASVRHGVLGPEEASRSIHECAALLGLQLATEIPVVTLIVTGMRKTVTALDLVDAFSEFGEIAEAAVAPNQRGFGILRFRTMQSVDRAMSKFRAEEIVVQDVAVQVRLLKPGIVQSPVDGDVTSTGI